jgi:hypothetical protein
MSVLTTLLLIALVLTLAWGLICSVPIPFDRQKEIQEMNRMAEKLRGKNNE